MKRRSKNYGQEFWATLTGNRVSLVAKHGSINDIIAASRELKNMNEDDLHRNVSTALSLVMDRKFPPSNVIRLATVWLRDLSLPLEPGKITCFARFHKTYRERIITSKN